MHRLNRSLARFAVLGVLAGTVPVLAQEIPNEGPVQTQALISVEAKQAVPLDPKMLKVEVNGHAAQLTGLARVQPAAAQVAILIDDGLRGSFGSQLGDLKNFIASLPPGMQVLVGYMRNGQVDANGGFSADHAAVAAGVRVPISSPGISASPYFCLSDFAKHWPQGNGGPRIVLMLTNGVDPYNGSTSIMNQDSPYVEAAEADAQRAGIAVYSVPYSDTGMRGGSATFSGQSYLQQVADATGGRSFYQGYGNIVSLAPFLQEFRTAIMESYTATFMAAAGHGRPGSLDRLKVTSSQPHVKVHAPAAVVAGSSE